MTNTAVGEGAEAPRTAHVYGARGAAARRAAVFFGNASGVSGDACVAGGEVDACSLSASEAGGVVAFADCSNERPKDGDDRVSGRQRRRRVRSRCE